MCDADAGLGSDHIRIPNNVTMIFEYELISETFRLHVSQVEQRLHLPRIHTIPDAGVNLPRPFQAVRTQTGHRGMLAGVPLLPFPTYRLPYSRPERAMQSATFFLSI